MTGTGAMTQALVTNPNPVAMAQPTTQASQNLNRWYYAAQTLSSVTQLASGFTGMSAYSSEADALAQQSHLAMQEAQQEAARKAREIGEFQSYQAALYAKSGVTLEGSPAIVMERTRQQGQEEVNAILRRGQAQSELLKQKSKQTRTAGRNALIGSVFETGSNLAQGYVYNKRANLAGSLALTNPYYGFYSSYGKSGTP